MSSKRYADDEAAVGSDSEEGSVLVSSDESENDINEYEKNSMMASEDEDKVGPAIRPRLKKDDDEDEADMECAQMTAEAIRKRSREQAEAEAAKARIKATAAAAVRLEAVREEPDKHKAALAAPASKSSFLRANPAAPCDRSDAGAASPQSASAPSAALPPVPTASAPTASAPTASAPTASAPIASAPTSAPTASAPAIAASSEPQQAPPAKRPKTLDAKHIPPRPALMDARPSKRKGRAYLFRVEFTDGVSARKFLDVVASAVTEMRFHICVEKGFTGLRLEAHDSNWHTAIRSQLECSLTPGETPDGKAATLQQLHDTSFTVSAARFMTALDCALLKDTTLSLTRYHAAKALEEVTFEAITNEDDVRTAYAAPLVASPDTQLGSLSQVTVELGFHVNVNIDVLSKLCSIAKRCAAATMDFEVFQAADKRDATVLHSRMHIGFGEYGGHDFYLTARKAGSEWVPVTGPSDTEREDISYVRKSSNSYDAAKLRLFVSKLSTEWVLVHLSNNSATKPIVLEANMGSGKSNHSIMIAPREQ